MRVLFLAHSFPRYAGDAAGAFILRLATALAHEDVSVKVIAPATAGAPLHDVIGGIPITRFHYAPRAMETLAYEGNMATQVSESTGAKLALVGLLAGVVALIVLLVAGEGVRSVWTLIQTCLILGSVLFATGLLGEQIAGQRAELRELRRQLDEVRSAERSDA